MRPARKFKRPASRFRKIAIGLVIVLIGIIAAALILPGYIDWNRFRGEIEQQASAITGRQVRIDGAIGFSLLPRPSLSIENATLANSTGASEPVMLGLERLEVQLGILPLLSGKIQVANFRLTAPVLNLETSPDGTNNWNFLSRTAAQPGIRFDHVLIERGRVRYRNHVTGADVAAEETDLQLSAVSLQGPFEVRGSLRLQDVPVRLDAALGVFAQGRATPVTVKSVLDGDTGVDFAGSISTEGDVTGNLNSQGTDLTGLITAIAQLGAPAMSGIQPAMLRRPYRIESAVALGADSLKFDKIKLDLGENALTGSLVIDTRSAPVFEAILNASSLDLDSFRAVVSPAAPAQGSPENSFSIPRDLSGAVRFTSNAIKLNDGHIRGVVLAATVADGIVTVDDLGAQFPGSAATRISGKLNTASGQPHFTGKLDLRAENLRGLLGWLGIEALNIPERSLSRAVFTALLDLSPELAHLYEIAAEIDSSILTGSLALAMRERTALGIDLNIDQLNVDNYLPQGNEHVQNAPATDDTAPGPAPDTGTGWTVARSLIDRFDSNFIMSVNSLTYRGVPISKLRAEGAVVDRALIVQSVAVGDLAGTAISISGVLSNFAAAVQGEINLRLASNDLSGLARTIGVDLPVPGAKLGKSSIEAKFLLADAGVEAVIDSRIGETVLQISGSMNGLAPGIIAPAGEQTTLKAHVSLANPSLRKIAVQTGLEIFPTPAEDAAGIALTAELASLPAEVSLSALNGTIGTTVVQGHASWNTSGAKPLLRAELTASAISGDSFSQATEVGRARNSSPGQKLPWSGAPFNLSYLDQFDADVKFEAERFSARGYDIIKPSLVIEIRDGQASLNQFAGNLFGGEASATASLRGGAGVPEFSTNWKLQGADMEAASAALSGSPAIAGRLDFTGAVKGTGASSFALASSLEGQAQITASNGFIRGMDLPAFSARLATLDRAADFVGLVNTVLPGGNTPYTRLSIPFTISQGVAQSNNPVIGIDSATGGLEVSIDLPRYWVNAEASLTLNEHMNAPPLGIAYIGSLNDPEYSLRTSRLENYFTQALLSKSLQRVINNRQAQPAPAPAVTAPQAAPQQAPPPKENKATNVINSILDAIIGDKPR
ncbi:MAG: AsmA family protein [Alphaproteobacteria bacterium]|nr:AsmA family protein [Alphaproteobacteria bacterium]